MAKLRVLYLGHSKNGGHPADRRRFLKYAVMNAKLEVHLQPVKGIKYDLVVATQGSDLVDLLKMAQLGKKFIFDYTNHYLVSKGTIADRFRLPAHSIFKHRKWSCGGYAQINEDLIRLADAVICPSVEQEDFLDKTIGGPVYRCTDFLEDEAGIPNNHSDKYQAPKAIFWEGQSSTLKHLQMLKNVFCEQPDLSLELVTDEYIGVLGGSVFRRRSEDYAKRKIAQKTSFSLWSSENVRRAADRSKLAVIPLDTNDGIARAKPENKLVFMWMLGLFTLCSPTISYQKLEKATGINFTVNPEDWNSCIEHHLCNSARLIEKAKELRSFAAKEYSNMNVYRSWNYAVESCLEES